MFGSRARWRSAGSGIDVVAEAEGIRVDLTVRDGGPGVPGEPSGAAS